jgi:transposase
VSRGYFVGFCTFKFTMFVRKKPNRSGSVSVQIVSKATGRYVVHKTVGSSADQQEIDYLIKKAKRNIEDISKQGNLAFDLAAEREFVDTFINHIDSLTLIGPELLLGKIFDDIGFNAIEDELFRHLVITRLVYPVSKLKTTDYLFKYKGLEISVYAIYRYLDKLYKHQIERIKQISLNHTLKLFDQVLSVVFYDVTTLYFEASDEDDLRKMGFSKDGKHQQPQIVLGLLVSQNGYPLDYDVFEGNKYEGETLIPVVEHFTAKYKPGQLIVIADAGLLSNKNIARLKAKQYQYILGGRIKNETASVTSQILQLRLNDNECAVIPKQDDNLIISYRTSRAVKDAKNRKRGLEKLEKDLKAGRLTKKHINNKGYNKYLILQGEVQIEIDYEKYEADARWDGLKGYLTNTTLPKEKVIEQYGKLWQIEKTFRISKSDLQVRPIYHRLQQRIEAHICISFAACKIYKELERLLQEKKLGLSPEKAIDILRTIYQVTIQTPYSGQLYTRLILKTSEQKELAAAFGFEN